MKTKRKLVNQVTKQQHRFSISSDDDRVHDDFLFDDHYYVIVRDVGLFVRVWSFLMNDDHDHDHDYDLDPDPIVLISIS